MFDRFNKKMDPQYGELPIQVPYLVPEKIKEVQHGQRWAKEARTEKARSTSHDTGCYRSA